MNAQLAVKGLVLAAVSIGIGATSWAVYSLGTPTRETAAKEENRVAQKLGGVLKISPTLAESYGIEAGPAEALTWHPRLFVDGRVLANPAATVEVRAPFNGIVLPGEPLALGVAIKPKQTLMQFEARFTQVERLDMQTKSVEAATRAQGAEDVVKVRQERLDQLKKLSASGGVAQATLDTAIIQLKEAEVQRDVALAQAKLWKQALEPAGKKAIIVTIAAPTAGEIAEVGAQPGGNVEAGQLLVRLVDFRRVLIRLDFPLSAGFAPPAQVEVEMPTTLLETPARFRATLRGAAPAVEVGLQRASYLYEIVPGEGESPPWRPGLFVRAVVPDPARTAQPAVAIPAAALLVHQGRPLVYVQLGPGRYERREVFPLDRDRDTLYVSAKGWQPGDDQVVVKNAQALLSEEFRPDMDDD